MVKDYIAIYLVQEKKIFQTMTEWAQFNHGGQRRGQKKQTNKMWPENLDEKPTHTYSTAQK